SLSPDGRRIAFPSAAGTERPSLWVRSMDSLTPQPIPEATGAPFWSPDGRWLGFVSGTLLKKIDVLSNGPAQVICDIGTRNFSGAAWSRDNVILFATNSNTANDGIYKVSASGGTPVRVTDSSGRGVSGHILPVFLADGHNFLYLRAGGRVDQDKQGV